MNLVLDTNVVLDLENGDRPTISQLSEMRSFSGELSVTAMTYYEVYYGVLKRGESRRNTTVKNLDSYELLNTSRESSMKLAEIRKSCADDGRHIPVMDMLIASIVMAHGATLVTRDKHFKEIEGLNVVVLE
jgi:tRNA(fMet)-specific endonuclease VapC